tara:strand:- start:500 stop:661 length:162 start_codon:yes stop_codon:yes gene_type:complete
LCRKTARDNLSLSFFGQTRPCFWRQYLHVLMVSMAADFLLVLLIAPSNAETEK